VSRLRLAALAASAVLLVPGVAEAGTTNQPYANGNNATGYGYGFSSTDFHDIDRKVCGLFGCNYDDGTNVFYGSGGTGYVSRAMTCGLHRYRHQSSDGGAADREIERVC